MDKDPNEPTVQHSTSQNRGYHDRGLVRAAILHVAVLPLSPVLPEWFRRSSSSSTLNGKLSQFARRKAPPTPVKTAKFRGALTPNASVIAVPNVNRRNPLSRAAERVCQPTRRRRPKRVSALVAMIPSVGIIAAGTYQLRVCVYSKNREKFPHSTFGCPKAPHRPNLSATAERKPSPSPNRKTTELRMLLLRDIPSSCSFLTVNTTSKGLLADQSGSAAAPPIPRRQHSAADGQGLNAKRRSRRSRFLLHWYHQRSAFLLNQEHKKLCRL